MKEGWKMVKLGEVCELKGGKRVPKGYKLEPEPTQHPYIRVADFNDLITWGGGAKYLNQLNQLNQLFFALRWMMLDFLLTLCINI